MWNSSLLLLLPEGAGENVPGGRATRPLEGTLICSRRGAMSAPELQLRLLLGCPPVTLLALSCFCWGQTVELNGGW